MITQLKNLPVILLLSTLIPHLCPLSLAATYNVTTTDTNAQSAAQYLRSGILSSLTNCSIIPDRVVVTGFAAPYDSTHNGTYTLHRVTTDNYRPIYTNDSTGYAFHFYSENVWGFPSNGLSGNFITNAIATNITRLFDPIGSYAGAAQTCTVSTLSSTTTIWLASYSLGAISSNSAVGISVNGQSGTTSSNLTFTVDNVNNAQALGGQSAATYQNADNDLKLEAMLADYRLAALESSVSRSALALIRDLYTDTNSIAYNTNAIWTTAKHIENGTDNYPTGGTISTSGAYRIHVFNSSGTFSVGWSAGTLDCEYLVVGGGGSGGSYCGGGGGGGGVTNGSVTFGASNITVTVGGGGTNSNRGFGTWNSWATVSPGSNGHASALGTITAAGGGYGGSVGTTTDGAGANGGCGGAAAPINAGTSSGTIGSGNPGKNGGLAYALSGGDNAGGGGGGMYQVGSNAVYRIGGGGGTGTNSTITGSSVAYGMGGGGSISSSGTAAGPGAAGGGGSGSTSGNGTAGTPNTGGGGGGGFGGSTGGYYGGAGGSGIVIVRYLTNSIPATAQNASITSAPFSLADSITTVRPLLLHKTLLGTLSTNLQLSVGASASQCTNSIPLGLLGASTVSGANIYTGQCAIGSTTSLVYQVRFLGTNVSHRLYSTSLWVE